MCVVYVCSVYDVIGIQLHYCPYGNPAVLAPLLQKMIFSANCFRTLDVGQFNINVRAYLWSLIFIPLTYVSNPLCLDHWSLLLSLKLGSLPALSLFFTIIFAILGPLNLHMNFGINLYKEDRYDFSGS